MNEKYNVYLISDSTGETLDRIFLSLQSQFENFKYEKKEFFFVRTEQQVDKIISDGSKGNNTIILYTIVETKLAKYLSKRSDEANIPVLCYGLRTDFQGELFPGSAALLGIADKLVEMKAVCDCGRKATMNLRVDESGKAVREGAQTEIGGNDRYVALCRKHFVERTGGNHFSEAQVR